MMATAPAGGASRSGRRASRRPFWTMARTEAILLTRNPGAALFIALLPVAALVVLGVVPGTRHSDNDLGGISYLDAYLPILMMFALLQSGVVMLSSTLASYREKGVLRRLATTPVPPARLLGVQALLYLGVGVAVDVIMLVIATAWGAPVRGQIIGLVLSLLLVATAMLGIGMLITALAAREQVAQAVSTLVLFPLMFFAGLWTPRAKMSPTLRTISDYTPLGAGVRAAQASIAGHWPDTAALLVIAAYAVICGGLAIRLFRWDWE
jgi:ABC-2 type transport system permease protein